MTLVASACRAGPTTKILTVRSGSDVVFRVRDGRDRSQLRLDVAHRVAEGDRRERGHRQPVGRRGQRDIRFGHLPFETRVASEWWR